MEEWKDGRVEEWKDGRVEGWKSGRVEEWKSGRVEEWKSGRVEEWRWEGGDGEMEDWRTVINRLNMKSIHTAVRDQFSQHADYYAQSTVHSKGATLDLILDFADAKGTERTLDIATGTGFTAFALAPKVADVVATDLTPEMVAKASELAQEQSLENVNFSVAAAESLPFATASFDLVTCRLAPHHFQNVPKFLGEVHRVLRIDGLFCIVDSVSPESEALIVWQNRVEKLRDDSHVFGYPPSQWDTMITDAGFEIERTAHTRNAQMSFMWWVRPDKNPPEVVKEIRDAFSQLSEDEAKEYYTVESGDEGDFFFSWPMYAVKARRK